MVLIPFSQIWICRLIKSSRSPDWATLTTSVPSVKVIGTISQDVDGRIYIYRYMHMYVFVWVGVGEYICARMFELSVHMPRSILFHNHSIPLTYLFMLDLDGSSPASTTPLVLPANLLSSPESAISHRPELYVAYLLCPQSTSSFIASEASLNSSTSNSRRGVCHVRNTRGLKYFDGRKNDKAHLDSPSQHQHEAVNCTVNVPAAAELPPSSLSLSSSTSSTSVWLLSPSEITSPQTPQQPKNTPIMNSGAMPLYLLTVKLRLNYLYAVMRMMDAQEKHVAVVADAERCEPQLFFILSLLAAAASGKSLTFYTSSRAGNVSKKDTEEFYEFICDQSVSIGDIYSCLDTYDEGAMDSSDGELATSSVFEGSDGEEKLGANDLFSHVRECVMSGEMEMEGSIILTICRTIHVTIQV